MTELRPSFCRICNKACPILVEVEGKKVWTCCSACPPKLKAEPAKYLARLRPPPQDEVLSQSVSPPAARRQLIIE